MQIGRLSAEKDIRFVLRTGRSTSLPLFRVKAVRTQRTSLRRTVIISKKQCKSAVDRNRMRRRVAEALARHARLFLKPVDFILFPTNAVLKALTAEIDKNTLILAKKINSLL